MNRRFARHRWFLLAAVLLLAAGLVVVFVGRGSSGPASGSSSSSSRPATTATSPVPGQKYQICDEQSQYLTSPWTYHALASGSQSYTVAQYRALPGYGKTVPPLPSYIASQSAGTKAAVIYAPGSSVNQPSYGFPMTPLLFFFEGGAYGPIGFEAVPGDQFIGGSAPGHREPAFNDGGQASGISAQNDTYDFSGGAGTLAAAASAGAGTITTKSPIGGSIGSLTFADGTTYQISGGSGTKLTLASGLTAAERAGTTVYAGRVPPIASVATAPPPGATP